MTSSKLMINNLTNLSIPNATATETNGLDRDLGKLFLKNST